MIVPAYWAEARQTLRHNGRNHTVHRFGWSDLSEADAAGIAQQRVEAAVAALVSGEAIALRERKMPYNGADGVPIREEIVGRHDDVVLTRNSYGAICLNAPDALFVDIDFTEDSPFAGKLASFAALCALAVLAGYLAQAKWVYVLGLLVALIAATPLARLVARLARAAQGGEQQQALRRIDAFLATRPDWLIRVYRSYAGLRLLVMHRPFAPDETETQALFAAVAADPVYVRMCRHQRCFRARLSPKPWRIGMPDALKPRPGVWPVRSEALPQRQAWVEAYTARASDYASCHFLAEYGRGQPHAKLQAIAELHDEACRALDAARPLA
ncbi:hypothetical protein [Chitinilyticum litopenaei]|uniref:hypothetical protein n=1 Tax=Chitinilyticum litopenaei TaxID=1121276 RepID=UPI00042540D5|nr:hypothetical protein [Chitinilyticum litopenaei]